MDNSVSSNRINLQERVLLVMRDEGRKPRTHLGTGFRAGRPGLAVTARHLVKNEDMSRLLVMDWMYASPVGVSRIHHPAHEADKKPPDLAVLELDGTHDELEFFQMGGRRVELGAPVASYGYPQHTTREGVTPRMMFGHVQRHYHFGQFDHHDEPWSYPAIEVGFPAFPGQSGSPVMLDSRINLVVGVVTTSLDYGSVTGEAAPTSASWAVVMETLHHARWIASL